VQRACERRRPDGELGPVALAAEAPRGVCRTRQQVRETIGVAGVPEQRGRFVDALAQLGDAGRRDRLSAGRLGDLPLVAGDPGPVQRRYSARRLVDRYGRVNRFVEVLPCSYVS
jgi:hypothetical protein